MYRTRKSTYSGVTQEATVTDDRYCDMRDAFAAFPSGLTGWKPTNLCFTHQVSSPAGRSDGKYQDEGNSMKSFHEHERSCKSIRRTGLTHLVLLTTAAGFARQFDFNTASFSTPTTFRYSRHDESERVRCGSRDWDEDVIMGVKPCTSNGHCYWVEQ